MAGMCSASVQRRSRWTVLVRSVVVVLVAGALAGGVVVALDGGGWKEMLETALLVLGIALPATYAMLAGAARGRDK